MPDAAKEDLALWTRVAERTIEVLASYTGEGVMFSVDTRLRPLGREGELVQTESAYKKYFAEQAQAWEAITGRVWDHSHETPVSYESGSNQHGWS